MNTIVARLLWFIKDSNKCGYIILYLIKLIPLELSMFKMQLAHKMYA